MKTRDGDGEFLTVAEVAMRLRYHAATVRNFVKVGKLPNAGLGRGIRIPRRAVEELERAGEARAAANPEP